MVGPYKTAGASQREVRTAVGGGGGERIFSNAPHYSHLAKLETFGDFTCVGTYNMVETKTAKRKLQNKFPPPNAPLFLTGDYRFQSQQLCASTLHWTPSVWLARHFCARISPTPLSKAECKRCTVERTHR